MPFYNWISNQVSCPYCQGFMRPADPAPGEREYRRACGDCRRVMTRAEIRARRRWNTAVMKAAATPPERRTKRQKTLVSEALAEVSGSPDLLLR